MIEKEIHIQIKLIPKCPALEEELFHCITYLVQDFACSDDAKSIQKKLDENSLGFEFSGKNTEITLSLINSYSKRN